MTLTRPREVGSPYEALARMVDQCGGLKPVAAFMGNSTSTVQRWTVPEEDSDVSFRLVSQIVDRFQASAPAEHLALLAGGVFVPLVGTEVSPHWGALTAESASAFAEAMGEVARALAPTSDGAGVVTRREARHLVKTIDHAIRDMAALRGLALAVAEGEP
ncbi:hypothetical protein FHS85_002900 [Rhodoligotrophos appendicifer]|uniref:phage regulatory CII family protein n=1 Tax=Rhodoligotrophos appendicifer TaxID=987056 RepID=UPI0011854B33|nr:phage regulatory CII family protein [Rhodoligotrophos appendicifer]